MTLFLSHFKHFHGYLPAGPDQWLPRARTGKVRADEAERLVRAYNLDHAKEMITRAVQMRRQVAQKGPLLAQVGYEETDGR